jgi:hypothetical protein
MAPAGLWVRAAAGMLGSIFGLAALEGEAEMVDASVVLGEIVVVLELEALGLLSAPHPEVSSIEAASGTASSAAEVFFTVSPTVNGDTSRAQVFRRSGCSG